MIKVTDLYPLLCTIGVPVTYYEFDTEKDEIPQLPFISYYCTRSDNKGADNITYFKSQHVNIELYTQKKDTELESKISDLLDSNEIFYDTEDVFISSSHTHITYYFITTGG